ncbi:MAG: phosphoribosyltransferase family protein, partial [Candidatus Altiarchaeota archaeon]|nr:phosphoribosyltransferase family protein [Candidatus Altiarchaeota archaeon]
WLSKETIDRIIKEQKQEIKRRVMVLRKGKPLPEIINKIVILVDDGIAMGSTMRAAIMLLRNNKAGRIIVASPVSGKEVAEEMGERVDEIVVLEKPEFFQAVAQVYRNWYDVSDREVIELMSRWQNKQ